MTYAKFEITGARLLIAGSAARSVSSEKLARAHAFVRLVARRFLDVQGGFVVLASGEPTTHEGTPLIFDWALLRELDAYGGSPETQSVVVTSPRARTERMTDEHRLLLARLSVRGLIEVVSIPDEVHTGGNISDEQIARASGMLAIGGGKGVADRARKLQKARHPVLPFDLAVGSLSNDGEGAVALHRQFLDAPEAFFPATGSTVRSRILGLSLETPVLPLERLADETVAIFAGELDAARRRGPLDVLVLTALPVELGAVRDVFGMPYAPEAVVSSGASYISSLVAHDDKQLLAGIATFGVAGNVGAAAMTAELVARLRPRLVSWSESLLAFAPNAGWAT